VTSRTVQDGPSLFRRALIGGELPRLRAPARAGLFFSALTLAVAAHAQEWQPKSGSSYARRREGRLKAVLLHLGVIRGAPLLITAILLSRWCGVAF
jgi:hypothetical protein